MDLLSVHPSTRSILSEASTLAVAALPMTLHSNFAGNLLMDFMRRFMRRHDMDLPHTSARGAATSVAAWMLP
jgi:hypothetical protein